MTEPLTPESLAELRRMLGNVTILRGTPRRAGKTYARETLAAAAVNALPALLDAAAFLDEVRAQVARGALCPMCSTGMTRQTVGMVCQLCGTDYGSPAPTT